MVTFIGPRHLLEKKLQIQMDQNSLIESTIEAIREENLNTLKIIASSIPEDQVSEILSQRSTLGRTPLIEAILKNNVSIVKYLLENCHVDPTVNTEHGPYPLYFSVFSGDFELTKLLVESGADINSFNYYTVSPLYIACQQGNLKMTRYLLESGGDINKSECLIGAIASTDVKLIEYVLNNGANVNVKDFMGDTPLHKCCYNDNLSIFEILIQNGAIRCANEKGVNQLQLAALEGSENICNFYSRNCFRYEVLNSLELLGVHAVLINDLPTSIRYWKKVLEEKTKTEHFFNLDDYQQSLQNNQHYDYLSGDIENAAIHSIIILMRIFGNNHGIIDSYFEPLLMHISILRTEFWEHLLNKDTICSKRYIWQGCEEFYVKKLMFYVQSRHYKDIDSSVLNEAIRFLNVTLDSEYLLVDGYAGKWFIDEQFERYVYLYAYTTWIMVIVCLNSIKNNVLDFDIKSFISLIRRYLNTKYYTASVILHILIRTSTEWKFPDCIIYETFEFICKLVNSVNYVDEEKNTPLHAALREEGSDRFIDILQRYGALSNTDMKNIDNISIKKFAVSHGRRDLSIGSTSLQSILKKKLRFSRVVNTKDDPSILKYSKELH